MNSNVGKTPVAHGLSAYIPTAVTFVLAIIMLLPIGTGADGTLMPNLVLISIFYWVSHRPMLTSFGACAALGFFLDLWLGVPLGLNMFLLVFARFLVISQLKHLRGRSLPVFWLAFLLTSAIIFIVSWVIISVVYVRPQPISPIIVSWVVTSFAYAPVAIFLGRLRRFMI